MPFQSGSGDGGGSRKRTTRKIVRPRSTPLQAVSNEDAAEAKAKGDADTGKSSRTRKIIRPRQAAEAPTAEAEPAPSTEAKPESAIMPAAAGDDAPALTPFSGNPVIGEDSGGRHVVIEPTARFEKIEDQGTKAVHKKKKKKKAQTDGAASSGSQTTIVTKDGKIDVGSTLKSRAKTIRASDLAARHDKVRVLNMGTIKELIQVAVQEAVERLGGAIDAKEKERLLKEAEENFQEQMKAFQAEKKGMEEQAKAMEEQLARAQRLLEEERAKEIQADQFTVSEAGMEDMEKRFDRLVERSIKVNGVNDALADELRNMVNHVLDAERDHIADQAKQAQSKAIAMLEKKVARLAGSLDDVERERDLHMRRANAMEAAGGGRGNIMDVGLGDDDPDKERKLSLLKDVFKQNQEMRDALKDAGIKIDSRRRRPKKPKAPPIEESLEAQQDDDDQAADAPAEEAAPAAEQAPTASTDDDDPYANMGNPDDDMWEPGMSFSTDVAGDDDDGDDGPVKKMTNFDNFAPPPLERSGSGAAASTDDSGDTASAAGDEDPYANMGDPDDEVWEPGMSFTTDVPGDDEGGDDDGVKKLTDFTDFEPPPLERRP